MAKSTWLKTAVINYFLRGQAVTQPTAVYASLHSADPGGDGASEISGNAYQRTAVTMGAPSGGVSANTNVVTFPTATPSGWGTPGYCGFWDAQSGGNFLYPGTIGTPKAINAGDTAQFNAGALVATET
jgi:hypothetical protein